MSQIQISGEAKIRDIQGPVVANSGVITALDGLPSQYVRGDGTLADFPTSTGGGSSVSYYLNGSVNQGTFAGSTYYQMSKDAITGVGTNFSASTDGLLAQFITDANDPDVSSIPSGNWNIEFYMGVSASSGALASFYVEFYKWNGSAFTFLASNVATPEFLTNTTTVDAYFTSVAFPETPLATTDRLAIRVYANVASKTVTMYTEDNRLCQIVTTFSKGLLSMNSLTDQEQYLTVGTAGTDFNIVSSIDTHTFNIPVASATNTGKLSSTDWSTFNNKVPYTGATGPVNLGAYDLTVNGLTIGKGAGTNLGNTAIGIDALSSNVSGYQNTAVGANALDANTTGFGNTATGSASLNLNTTGYYNTGFGYFTLRNNTTGYSNTAVGVNGLALNTTGFKNTGVGSLSLNENTTGNDNTALGAESLQNNTTGNQNTALGTTALKYNTTGYVNTAVGSEALLQNTTGSFNTAVGSATLSSNTTGTSNNAFGRGALNSNTTGANNVAIGNAALFGNINGNQNTAIGVSTLQNNVADENTAIGYAALNLNTFGEGNVAIGISALQNSTVASLNTAVGSYALWNNQTAAYNTAIGASALQSNLTGTRNTTLGWNSGSSITTGSNNTIIGVYTGTSSMSSNVILADGQGNIRYRFDGTNNNFYNNIDLGINELTAGFVTSTGGMYATYGLRAGYGIILDKNGIVAGAGAGQMQIYAPTGTASVLTIKDGNSNFNAQLTFDNTASRNYTFPASSGTVALTGDLSSYVTLSTAQTISGNKTFSGTSLFTGTSTFNSSLQAAVGIIFPTSGVVSNGAGIVGLGAYSGGLRTAFNGGYTSDLAFQMGANYVYTFPSASGTIALTSNLSAYLPLTGGTLTGALSGTSATFSGQLTLNGSDNQIRSGNELRFYRSDNGIYTRLYDGGGANGFVLDNRNGDGFNFQSAGTSQLRIASTGAATFSGSVTAGGNISINYNTGSKLGFNTADAFSAYGTSVAHYGISYGSNTNPLAISGYYGIGFFADGTERMRITSVGDLLVGDTSGFGYKMRVKNTASVPYGISMVYTASPNVTGDSQFLICADGTNDKFIVWSSGTAQNRTGVYGTLSDATLKENIIDTTPKLDKLLQLKVRNFNFIGEDLKQLGFVAQEMEQVFPNMVDTDKEGIKSVKTTILIPMLVKSLQESHQIIKELEARIVTLESKIN